MAIVAAGATTLAAFSAPDTGGRAVAQCRAVFGSLNNGTCLDGPSDPGTAGIPAFGIGPTDNGPGISTGPLFPGQTINTPVGP